MDPAGLSSLCVNKRLLDVMDPAGLSSLCNNVVHAVSKIFCNDCLLAGFKNRPRLPSLEYERKRPICPALLPRRLRKAEGAFL